MMDIMSAAESRPISCPPKSRRKTTAKHNGTSSNHGRHVKTRWTEEEDKLLLRTIRTLYEERLPAADAIDWKLVKSKMSNRTRPQLRERYVHVLNPEVDRSRITNEQMRRLLNAQLRHGNRWKVISREFPGRTTLFLKNAYFSVVRRFKRRYIHDPQGSDLVKFFEEELGGSLARSAPRSRTFPSNIESSVQEEETGVTEKGENRFTLMRMTHHLSSSKSGLGDTVPAGAYLDPEWSRGDSEGPMLPELTEDDVLETCSQSSAQSAPDQLLFHALPHPLIEHDISEYEGADAQQRGFLPPWDDELDRPPMVHPHQFHQSDGHYEYRDTTQDTGDECDWFHHSLTFPSTEIVTTFKGFSR
eukprot:gb/GECG01013873.1/.p1 GENE.gb/GECG01013873.1/~~gb/GECG01013873.1/.p1  ORF type:complete len:359 (+),score=44.21 gb/GECG01013873.1/:1-1077(+)